jgi:hypothetical protein
MEQNDKLPKKGIQIGSLTELGIIVGATAIIAVLFFVFSVVR